MGVEKLIIYALVAFFAVAIFNPIVLAQGEETIVIGTLENRNDVQFKFTPAITQYTTSSKTVIFKIIEKKIIFSDSPSEDLYFSSLSFFYKGSPEIIVISPSKEKINTTATEFAYTFNEEGEYQVIVTVDYKVTPLCNKLLGRLCSQNFEDRSEIMYRIPIYYLPKR